VRAGVEVCFANPGTTEMGLVRALDEVPEMRAVLGLFEGVCTGAAAGYGRMRGHPALTLLHLGPGLANGLANLHNARRAHAPVVNLVGDHASWHLAADAPLTSDIESLARPVSGWFRHARDAGTAPRDLVEAVAAAVSAPGAVATLVLPTDVQEGAASPCEPMTAQAPAAVSAERLASAREALSAEGTALLLGSSALTEVGLAAAGRIAAATGARLIAETFSARAERGAALPRATRLPYFPEPALAMLEPFRRLLLFGSRSPVAFFGYSGLPSSLVPESCRAIPVAAPGDDAVGALVELAEAFPAAPAVRGEPRPEAPVGDLTPESLALALCAVQPDGAIVVDEAATSGGPYAEISHRAPPHTVLQLTGGAIGQGMPCATGAAIACPERPVISLQADGSGLYTLQALWTQAREGLDVTTVLCSNRSYRILRIELARVGIAQPGEKASALTDLGTPDLDWTQLATGFGVPAARVERAEDLHRELERALREPGPHLIEAVL
jgi:acetolactate synthase-1/2/3 large subunit